MNKIFDTRKRLNFYIREGSVDGVERAISSFGIPISKMSEMSKEAFFQEIRNIVVSILGNENVGHSYGTTYASFPVEELPLLEEKLMEKGFVLTLENFPKRRKKRIVKSIRIFLAYAIENGPFFDSGTSTYIRKKEMWKEGYFEGIYDTVWVFNTSSKTRLSDLSFYKFIPLLSEDEVFSEVFDLITAINTMVDNGEIPESSHESLEKMIQYLMGHEKENIFF